MRKSGGNGKTVRWHLRVLANRGDAGSRAQLEGPPVPEGLAYLWDWFWELDAGRAEGFTGPAAFSYQELDAWARLTGRQPSPHEVQALMSIDLAVRHPAELRA